MESTSRNIMLHERTAINGCYTLQYRIGEDSFTDQWIATAIFSATKFLLRFIVDTGKNINYENLLSESMHCYSVRGQFVADFVEIEFFNDRMFICYEYHDEKNLLSVINQNTKWTLDRICIFVTSMARGIEAFHSQGLIYGNLNAENILVQNADSLNSFVKIQKPGLLSMLSFLGNNELVLRENYGYLAPEYKQGHELCRESDIYSLGIHLTRFFTGKLPFPDSLKAVMEKPAALRYVTNALFRRGVPEPLVRITLRSLMPDPLQRYRSCDELIHDLLRFMESYSLKTYESSVYFKLLNDNQVNKNMYKNILFPITELSGEDAIEQKEKEELITISEEQYWSVNDYIEYGISNIPESTAEKDIGTTTALPGLYNKLQLSRAEEYDIIKEKKDFNHPATNSLIKEFLKVSQDDVAPEKHFNILSSPAKSFPAINQSKSTEEHSYKKISWNHHHIRVQDVTEIIRLSVKRAHKCKGSFRYIQDPEINISGSDLNEFFKGIRGNHFYINIGSCTDFAKADTSVFLDMLREGIARELSDKNKRSYVYYAQGIKKSDVLGIFASAPLGKMLYGYDSKKIKGRILKTKKCRISIVHSLFALGRAKKPLVLIVQGGENIEKDLHRLFTAIANEIYSMPVCVFVFFRRRPINSWHVLSAYLESKKHDTGI